MALEGLGFPGIANSSFSRALPAKEVFVRGLDLAPAGTQAFPKLTSPYSQHATVYSCVRVQYATFAQAPLRLWRGETEVTSGPLFERLHNPTPKLGLVKSGVELWQYTILFLELFGNTIWWLDNDGKREQIPRNILVFNPKHFSVIVDKQRNILVGYRFNPGGGRKPTILSPDEIVHYRYPNPDDPWWGIGPMEVARLSAEQDHKAASYNSAFFDNSAEPGGLMIYKGDTPLTQTQRETVIENWREQHQGAGRAFKLGVLPGKDWDYQQLGLNQRDMQFMEQRGFNKKEIAEVFDVPLIFLQEHETTGLSDAGLKVQKRLFWETNLIPKGILLQDIFNSEFVSRFDQGIVGLFDTDQVAALKEDFTAKLEQAKTLHDMHVPFNAINEQLDLGFEPLPWGDEALVPISLVPISAVIGGLPAPESDNDSGRQVVRGDNSSLELAKARYWRAFVDSFSPIERRYQARLSRYFYDLRTETLNNLVNLERIGEGEIGAIIFDFDRATRTLRALSQPFFSQAYTLGGHLALGELNVEPGLFLSSQDSTRFLEKKLIKVTQINDTIRQVLRSTLSDSLGKGETLSEVSDRIRHVFNVAANRARVIARTEIGQSVSGGRFEGFIQQKVEHHAWLSSRDIHVRESHKSPLDGQVVAIGEKFRNGLKFPLDPDGDDAREIVNCFLPGTRVSGRFIAGLKAWYSGEAVEIVTRKGCRVSVTVNHPILTQQGFIAANKLRKGDYVVCQRANINRRSSGWHEYNQQMESRIEDVFDTLSAHRGVSRAHIQPVPFDLHGDAKNVRGQIERVILLDSLTRTHIWTGQAELVNQGNPPVLKHRLQLPLVSPEQSAPPVCAFGFYGLDDSISGYLASLHSEMGCPGLSFSFLSSHRPPLEGLCIAPTSMREAVLAQDPVDDVSGAIIGPGQPVDAFAVQESGYYHWFKFLWNNALCVGWAANLNLMCMQESIDGITADSEFASKLISAYPAFVLDDEIVNIRQFYFSGHVYDLQSPVGYMIAGGIASSNCRCTTIPVADKQRLLSVSGTLNHSGNMEG